MLPNMWNFLRRFCAPHLPRADPRADGTALGGPEGTCDGTSASVPLAMGLAQNDGTNMYQ